MNDHPLSKLYDHFDVDEIAEVQGVWMPIQPGLDCLIARHENDDYREAVPKIVEPYTEQMDMGMELSPELRDEMTADVMARTILLDWRGKLVEGVPYTPEAGKQALLDLKAFRDLVSQRSMDWRNYRKAQLTKLAKNSEAQSRPDSKAGNGCANLPAQSDGSQGPTQEFSPSELAFIKKVGDSGKPTGDSETESSAPSPSPSLKPPAMPTDSGGQGSGRSRNSWR